MIWNITGRKQKVKDYRLHKEHMLDESSEIYQKITAAIKENRDFIANLGHSTFLISYKGKRVLTDPFLSPHIFGIKRQKPALRPDLVPQVDLIVISHAHYDHLDMRTLRRLDRESVVIIPENTKPVLGRIHFKEIMELKHFETTQKEGIKITSLPVKHNKGRSILFPNTEVASYLITIEDKTFYFGGDTAYFESFKEYGKKFKINIAFLPIGGYEPTLILHKVHMNPHEAVNAFLDLNADYIVPIHYGTFHTIPKFVQVEAPLKHFKEEISRRNINNKAIIIEPNNIFVLTQ